MLTPPTPGRTTWRRIIALALIAAGPAPAFAQDGKEWVGRRVITRFGATLRVDGRVIDNEKLEDSPTGGRRNVFRIYRVERVDGAQLWIKDEKSGVAGWVSTEWIIPYDLAIDYFSNEIRANPDAAWPYTRRAQIRTAGKEYDLAIADLNEALRIDPNSETAWINRGVAWSAKKDHDLAIADFDEALRIDPKCTAALNNRGLQWSAKKDYGRAIADYDEAIRLDPSLAAAFNNRGNARRSKKDLDRAIADYDESIRLVPTDSLTHLNRSVAGLLLRRGEAGDGFQATLDLAEGRSRRAAYAVILGHLAAKLTGDEAKAGAFLGASASKLDPGAWPFPAVKFLRGELDEAGLLALAVDDDKKTEAHCYLGLDSLTGGRRDEALAHFRWVRDHGTTTYTEYQIAIAELDRLEKPASPPTP